VGATETVRRARETTRLQRPRACPVQAAAALTATAPAVPVLQQAPAVRVRQQALAAPVRVGPVRQQAPAAPVQALPVRLVPAETVLLPA